MILVGSATWIRTAINKPVDGHRAGLDDVLGDELEGEGLVWFYPVPTHLDVDRLEFSYHLLAGTL